MTDETEARSMARGTLGITADGAFQLRFERHFQRSASEVWPWLVDPEKLARWLPGCQITASVDGPVVFDFGDEGAATGKVTSLQAPDDGAGHLEHTWEWEGLPISIVRWQIIPTGKGSLLTLTHSELVEEPAREFALGWHMILGSLELDLAGLPIAQAWEVDTATAWYYQTL